MQPCLFSQPRRTYCTTWKFLVGTKISARAHELLNDAMLDDPSLNIKLMEKIDNGDLPQSYFKHPIVEGASEPILPLSLFIDGVPYSQNDSVIGFWVQNEITKDRYLVAALRKHLACGCGCRGWCSFVLHICLSRSDAAIC